MFRGLLLTGAAIAGAVAAANWLAPTAIGGAIDSGRVALCARLPEDCRAARARSIQREMDAVAPALAAAEDGLHLLNGHEKAVQSNLDGLAGQMIVFAKRVVDARTHGNAVVRYMNRDYAGAEQDAQMRLWQEQRELFERVLQQEVAPRRAQLAQAQETLELARSHLVSALLLVQVDGRLGEVSSTMQEAQHLLDEAEAARNVAGMALAHVPVSPVRPIEQILKDAEANGNASQGGHGAFDFNAWLHDNTPAAPD